MEGLTHDDIVLLTALFLVTVGALIYWGAEIFLEDGEPPRRW